MWKSASASGSACSRLSAVSLESVSSGHFGGAAAATGGGGGGAAAGGAGRGATGFGATGGLKTGGAKSRASSSSDSSTRKLSRSESAAPMREVEASAETPAPPSSSRSSRD